jgi:glycosyltransferase involved in cell wall biosynthesis
VKTFGVPESPSPRVDGSVAARSRPVVQILLSTYDGERYLGPLLRSLDEQTYPELDLLVRDDGSTDGTVAVLQSHAGRIPRSISVGPRMGLPATFFELLRHARPDAELFAFCDQDDVWLPRKIERAVEMLEADDATGPLLYCCRTRYVDARLRPLGLSELPCHPLSFRNALTRNMATGCTIVMNRAARDLVLEVVPTPGDLHDVWAYLVVSAFGTVIYDPVPMLEYRQHGANVIGVPSISVRLVRLFTGKRTGLRLRRARRFRRLFGDRLREEDRRVLDELLRSRRSVLGRVRYALSMDRQRTGLAQDLALRLLFIAGRM